jgi:hypothetical protein
MLSIQGIYTGKEIKPLEEIHVRPNVRVIITFLEDELREDAQQKHIPEDPTQVFLEKCGGWEDTQCHQLKGENT